MKICIYDKDVRLAAQLAVLIKHALKTDVVYVEELTDPALSTAMLLVADPGEVPTAQWVRELRETGTQVPLFLLSANADLLSGSMADTCYAMSKPITEMPVVLAVIRGVLIGQPWSGGTNGRTEKRAN